MQTKWFNAWLIKSLDGFDGIILKNFTQLLVNYNYLLIIY